ncbi:chitin synthase chs-2-like [Saccostrea echinata]|uniref:chitin synthase chs-2-like n=1 Tax=Saccostrea echinata TaxID=191078 RepID=UPI002A800B38|nr:chitin synthase chs-2-like [Saccostrea echinata]
MDFAPYRQGSGLRMSERGISRSLTSLGNEMDVGAHRNPAYEDDSCDSIESFPHSTESETSDEKYDEHYENQKAENIPIQRTPLPEDFSVQNSQFSHRSTAKMWDVFQVSSEDNVSGSELACWNACFYVTRIALCIVLFTLVFMSSVISKFTFLVMTANIFPATNATRLKSLGGTLSYSSKFTDINWIWGMLITISAPYLFTVFKYTWVLLFKNTWSLHWNTLLVAFFTETLHSIGLCTFTLVVLPSFDPITACILCFSISMIPGILKIIFPSRDPQNNKKLLKRVSTAQVAINTLAALCQLGSIGLWSYYVFLSNTNNSIILIILVILSPILISISWWENFVSQPESDKISKINSNSAETNAQFSFPIFQKNMRKERVRIGIITNLWKIILTLIIMPSVLFGGSCKDGEACIRTIFFEPTGKAEIIRIASTNLTINGQYGDRCVSYLPYIVSLVNVISSIICYKCVKAASKILAQKLCFALPIVLSTPAVFGLFFGIYSHTLNPEIPASETWTIGTCIFPLPYGSNNNVDPSILFKLIEFYWPALVAGILGFLSFLVISNHIWAPNKERLIPTDRLFVRALYCGAFLDQALFLNRRRIDKELKIEKHKETKEVPLPDNNDDNAEEKNWSILREDDTPMIYMCATMWHESETEMVQILKSIFRQDIDQCARTNVQTGLGIKDPDYYEFEAHIFFDDAFESRVDSKGRYKVNSYVKQLINSIHISARSVYGRQQTIPPPSCTETPYGGRLEWNLPGGNNLIAHLKDKTKIRHRKRWSQVMYMYYFLAYKLMKIPKKTRRQKRTIAENTFLLALDGDVDFQPKAVQLLVDRMRKNPDVGAACGRIHPIGTGPMVWYQKFEYAVSHWLQKAAENVLGCVLCSPGCFSLFRGSSLMDDNVMARYTTRPTEPHHYVQYDQGEDRWLCTLLLQQGYRVEYVAASDALTYAPETFNEFYNQRRRWSPSTMANVLDLLMDWKNVTRKNEDISKLYILYQMFLMICSILTPGTIFLMILGAISMAFPAIPPVAGMIINLVPVTGMVILCFTAKPNFQLAYAAVVSTIYSLLMMVVLVGLLVEAATAGFCSVTTLFLLFVVGVFLVSAIVHPQEFYCVLHGFIYFLSIPSMSMLLMIYSLGNLHVVSWGTRETKETQPQQTPTKVILQDSKTKSQTLVETLGFGINGGKSDYLFSCGKFIRCCPTKKPNERLFQVLLDRLDDIEAQISKDSREPEQESLGNLESAEELHFTKQNVMIDGAVVRDNPMFNDEGEFKNKEATDSWISDEDLKACARKSLETDEMAFWQEFIPKYLQPLAQDKEHEKQMQHGLIELRNKVCLGFLLMNALFVTIVYVLTEVNATTNQTLSIKLPCTVEGGRPGRGYIEPISFAFTAIFGIMLFLQFICMLMHRMSTFIHIAASTQFNLSKKLQDWFYPKEQGSTDIGVEEGLEVVKQLQAVKEDDTISIASQETTFSEDSYTRSGNKTREMWKRYTRRLRERTSKQPQELRVNFAENLDKFTKALQEGDDASTKGIHEESNSNVHDEKISQVQKLLKNRFNRKTLHTVRTIAENQARTQEIKRRATALNKKKRIESRWNEIYEKGKLYTEIKNQGQPGRTSRVGFASVATAAVAQENRKRLEENEEKLMDTITEDDDSVVPSVFHQGKTGVSFASVAKAALTHKNEKHLEETLEVSRKNTEVEDNLKDTPTERTSRIGFASIAKVVVAQEKQKHLENTDHEHVKDISMKSGDTNAVPSIETGILDKVSEKTKENSLDDEEDSEDEVNSNEAMSSSQQTEQGKNVPSAESCYL